MSMHLDRISAALKLIVQFSAAELDREQREYLTNTDSIFFGAFSFLTDILSSPSCETVDLVHTKSIIATEKERLELEWQAMRKCIKKQ